MRTKGLKVFFGFILFLWLVPVIMFIYPKSAVFTLDGAFIPASDTLFSKEMWFSGEYQKIKEKYLEENIGLRTPLIKSNNQFLYGVLGITNAYDIVFGKGNHLFENKNILAYSGFDFMGDRMIKCRTEMLKMIQDTLEKKGKFFCIIHAPNKATYIPENILVKPKKYGTTNIGQSLKFESEHGVNFLDLNTVFKQNKSKSKHALYPETGTHWSIYGIHLGFNSILDYFEKNTKKKQVKIDYSNCEMDYARSSDDDIQRLMNLWYPISKKKLAYPKVKIDTTGVDKVKIFIVSDSYWLGIHTLPITSKVFESQEFVYYSVSYQKNNMISSTIDFAKVDLRKFIDRNDVICISSADAQLPFLGWGFIENLFETYYPNHPYRKQLDIFDEDHQTRLRIMNTSEWRKKLERTSEKKNEPFHNVMDSNIDWIKSN